MSDTIEVEGWGPIEGEFTFDLNGPGAYELVGAGGKGKSTVLSCLNMIAGHKVDLTVNDNCDRARVSGFGRVVTQGKRLRTAGDLSVDVLPERFDLHDLLVPSGKTPETRDGARIKALASLTKCELKPEDFHDLVGGKDKFFELGIEVTDDPVLLTSRVKSALDRAARNSEKVADHARGQADSENTKPDGVDLTAESDPSVLADAAEKAAEKVAALREQAKAAIESKMALDAAQEKLAASERSYTGPTLEAAEAIAQATIDRATAAKQKADALREQLRIAEQEEKDAIRDCESAGTAMNAARQYFDSIAAWRETIEAGVVEVPKTTEIEAAEKARDAARLAQEQGVRIRDAKAASERAASLVAHAKSADKQAASLRAAASQAFEILTQSLDMKFIRIKADSDGNPRLTAHCEQRGWTNFDAVDGLSSSQQIKAAIQELLLKLPKTQAARLFTIDQGDWQHLPQSELDAMHDYAAREGIYVIGARITEGDLRIVPVKGGEA